MQAARQYRMNEPGCWLAGVDGGKIGGKTGIHYLVKCNNNATATNVIISQSNRRDRTKKAMGGGALVENRQKQANLSSWSFGLSFFLSLSTPLTKQWWPQHIYGSLDPPLELNHRHGFTTLAREPTNRPYDIPNIIFGRRQRGIFDLIDSPYRQMLNWMFTRGPFIIIVGPSSSQSSCRTDG